MKAPLPEARQQRLGQIALISKHFPPQSSRQGLQWFAVIGIARCHLAGHERALLVNEQVELEAKEPQPMVVRPGWAQPAEDPVAADGGVMVECQLDAVGTGESAKAVPVWYLRP